MQFALIVGNADDSCVRVSVFGNNSANFLCPSARRVNLRRSWLRHCDTSRKFAGFSPIGSLRFYIQLTLGSTQPIAEMQMYLRGG
jgi:hypothetical protein